ncbi:MAG: phosphatidylserine synthase [Methylococcales bacterium]|jgi:CDP-diacylglycerol---serine O-phosphatidyltransferase|nr:phosphatidylserine synthase [Methylococcales bacterium]MBT7443261.1 phosphatidylserine synthase [Methylococcales bacterium]
MQFFWRAESHFNLANLVTMINIASGVAAAYLISQNHFFEAIVLAWIGGACDIIDGKIARKYNLSGSFGIQLDSFADFITFVLVPVFLVFQTAFTSSGTQLKLWGGAVSIYYVISGLRRLIQFNINSNVGEVSRFFTGVPTPLGGILLWLLYLGFHFELIGVLFVSVLMILVGWLLNSNVKIPHP